MNASTPRTGWRALLGAPLLLAVAVLATTTTLRLPASRSDSDTEFCAPRALETLRRIASEPRPVGSAAHVRAKAAIIDSISGCGLTPSIQSDDGVSNILARVEGAASSGTVLFVAHYDSLPETPGASDNGAAVVALLQVLELVHASGPPRNDLLFLFSDGEEIDLLGARLFVREYEELDDIACVINFDAIGNDGPLVLFEIGTGSGELIRRYARCVRKPVASSAGPAIYARMPNDTDFTPFREHGMRGLNLAVVGGGAAYHAPFDRPDRLSIGTLQLIGDTALELARDLGSMDLADLDDTHRGEQTFFDVVGLGLIVFGRTATFALILISFALLGGAAFVLGRAHALGPKDLANGLFMFVALALTSTVLLSLEWTVVSRITPKLTAGVVADAERGSNFRSVSLLLIGMGLSACVIAHSAIGLIRRHKDGERRLAACVTVGVLSWAVLIGALVAVSPEASAELPIAAILASSGVLLRNRIPLALPVLASAATALLAPHVALACFLVSKTPDQSATLAAICLPIGFGLVGTCIAEHSPQRTTLVFIAVLGLALLFGAARLHALGN